MKSIIAKISLASLLLLIINSTASFAEVPPFAMPEKELMVPVEGGKIYVRVNGLHHESTLPVLFIHGGPGGTHNGFAALTRLADERSVIMYDQLGSGRSEQPNNPDNWRPERFVEAIESIRNEIGIDRWHIVGQSWGSALALLYTAKHPERVASTVLGGTFISTPHWIMDANLLIKAAPELVQETLRQCESENPPAKEECTQAYRKLYSTHYQPSEKTKQALAYDETIGGNGSNELMYRTMWGPSEFSSTGSLKSFDAVNLLSEVNASRLLFLIGQYDSARIDTVQNYITLAPGAQLAVIPGAAHGFIKDRPEITEAIIRDWLKRNDPHE